MKKKILILMMVAAMLAAVLPAALAEPHEKEQQAIDRAWLYLTDEQGIAGELLQEATYEKLIVTLFGPEQLVELVSFTSALSTNIYSVYMEPETGEILLADEFMADGGLCLTKQLYLAPGLVLDGIYE